LAAEWTSDQELCDVEPCPLACTQVNSVKRLAACVAILDLHLWGKQRVNTLMYWQRVHTRAISWVRKKSAYFIDHLIEINAENDKNLLSKFNTD
jgi:hypothetical protein